MELYLLWLVITWLASSNGLALGETCWRNTPCNEVKDSSFPGEWESNIFAPASRTVTPSAAFDLGTHKRLSSWPEGAILQGSQKGVYFDFGSEVGGIITIEFEVLSVTHKGTIALAFAEARDWIGPVSDSSSGNYGREDGALRHSFFAPGKHTYVVPDKKLRGGFRYMTLVVQGNGASIRVKNVSLEISFQPTWSNLRAYRGYFHSSDDLLNKIWYSCAYTLQLSAVHPETGRAWPSPGKEWHNNGNIGPGHTINIDGAKRDRTVWPGDMGVAIPASAYSTGDVESVRNALRALYHNQDLHSGSFPYCGPPITAHGSATYHMWTMIGTYNYVLYSGDVAFIRENWKGYVKGMRYLFSLVDRVTNLIKVPDDAANDWGQPNVNGFHTSAQVLFFHTLITGAKLADWIGDTPDRKATWLKTAKVVKVTMNELHWDRGTGAFWNNLHHFAGTAGIHPQDGNSLAVFLGVVKPSSTRAQAISSYLTRNWTPIGAASPELPGEISPFISSFEIQAHHVAGHPQRALDLIRSSWGWYLNNENGTQSTAIEGYLLNGTFGYRWNYGYDGVFSYTSHAHGWATGPVTALTEYILGLSIVGLAGATWRLAPQFGDLRSCQGGFTTKLGKFSASWTLKGDQGYTLEYDTPKGTGGDLLLPSGPRGTQVIMDDGELKSKDIVEASGNRQLFALRSSGGMHRIEVSWTSDDSQKALYSFTELKGDNQICDWL